MCSYKCIHTVCWVSWHVAVMTYLRFKAMTLSIKKMDLKKKKQTWCCQTQHLFEGLSLKPVHGRFSDFCCCCSLGSFSLTFIRTLEMSFSTGGKQRWNFQLWSKELKSFTLFSEVPWPCHTHNFELWAVDTLEDITNRNITTTCSIVAQV